jgi:hypothetical protein
MVGFLGLCDEHFEHQLTGRFRTDAKGPLVGRAEMTAFDPKLTFETSALGPQREHSPRRSTQRTLGS